MKKPNMTKIEQIEHFQTRVHRFSLLMSKGDFHHHHTLYIMYASRFKSPKNMNSRKRTPKFGNHCGATRGRTGKAWTLTYKLLGNSASLSNPPWGRGPKLKWLAMISRIPCEWEADCGVVIPAEFSAGNCCFKNDKMSSESMADHMTGVPWSLLPWGRGRPALKPAKNSTTVANLNKYNC